MFPPVHCARRAFSLRGALGEYQHLATGAEHGRDASAHCVVAFGAFVEGAAVPEDAEGGEEDAHGRAEGGLGDLR